MAAITEVGPGWIAAGALLAIFSLNTGYFLLSELLMRGSTFGKKALKLRVVTLDGAPPGLTASLIRNLLRIVDLLEERYPGFRGLNLTEETREGILKHGCGWDHPVPVPAPTPSPSLEAQVADASDEIAYTNHDLDDGLRSGLLELDMLSDLRLWTEARRRAAREDAP